MCNSDTENMRISWILAIFIFASLFAQQLTVLSYKKNENVNLSSIENDAALTLSEFRRTLDQVIIREQRLNFSQTCPRNLNIKIAQSLENGMVCLSELVNKQWDNVDRSQNVISKMRDIIQSLKNLKPSTPVQCVDLNGSIAETSSKRILEIGPNELLLMQYELEYLQTNQSESILSLIWHEFLHYGLTLRHSIDGRWTENELVYACENCCFGIGNHLARIRGAPKSEEYIYDQDQYCRACTLNRTPIDLKYFLFFLNRTDASFKSVNEVPIQKKMATQLLEILNQNISMPSYIQRTIPNYISEIFLNRNILQWANKYDPSYSRLLDSTVRTYKTFRLISDENHTRYLQLRSAAASEMERQIEALPR